MTRQIIFALTLLITLGVIYFTIVRIVHLFRFTRPAFPVRDFGKRFSLMMKVAFGQSRIFRKPILGLFHALVFWGFCIILFGSIEMVIDGLSGTERALRFLGPVYDFIIASGDIFAVLVAISIIVFLVLFLSSICCFSVRSALICSMIFTESFKLFTFEISASSFAISAYRVFILSESSLPFSITSFLSFVQASAFSLASFITCLQVGHLLSERDFILSLIS